MRGSDFTRAVRVDAPNPQIKPARAEQTPIIDYAEFINAFVTFEPKFGVMLLSCG